MKSFVLCFLFSLLSVVYCFFFCCCFLYFYFWECFGFTFIVWLRNKSNILNVRMGHPKCTNTFWTIATGSKEWTEKQQLEQNLICFVLRYVTRFSARFFLLLFSKIKTKISKQTIEKQRLNTRFLWERQIRSSFVWLFVYECARARVFCIQSTCHCLFSMYFTSTEKS